MRMRDSRDLCQALTVRCLLVLAVSSQLAVAWAAGADFRQEDPALTPPRKPLPSVRTETWADYEVPHRQGGDTTQSSQPAAKNIKFRASAAAHGSSAVPSSGSADRRACNGGDDAFLTVCW